MGSGRIARAPAVLLVVVVVALGGVRNGDGGTPPPTIVALGDSITAGITRSGTGNDAAHAAQHDPEGGYPGRLARSLGTAAVVKSRGAGGATTGFFLDAPGVPSAQLVRFAEALWPGFGVDDPVARGTGLADLVFTADRPDVVLILLGANDLAESRPGGVAPDPEAIARRVIEIADRARSRGARAIVATLLPNRRDPAEALAGVNRHLCRLDPTCLRLDDAWRAAGGESLLGDEIHPSAAGHAAIAAAFAAALRERGVVGEIGSRPAQPSAAPSPSSAPP